MPGRTLLSILDCKKILTLSLRGPTIREIAFELQRNKKTICSFLKNPGNYGTTRRTGPTPKIDDRTKRQIKRLELKKTISPNKIKTELNLKGALR